MTDLVGIREAARALGVSPSTISRYVSSHPELNRGTPEQPAVALEELRAHRAQNVNGLKSRSHAGELFDDGVQDRGETAARDTAGARPTTVPKGAYSQAKAARETLAARKAQIELDQMLDRLLPRAEVDEGAAELAGVLQVGLMQLSIDLAEPLATMTEPTEISVLLDKSFRRLLLRLSTQLEGAAKDMTDAAA